MKTILLIILTIFQSPQKEYFKLQSGDLIFQESCTEASDNTIKAVTSSIGDYKFTHVGIVYIDEKGNTYVIEATHPKVKITLLKDYLFPRNRCFPQSVVGRLKEKYRHCIPQAIKEGLSLVGKDYDYGYILNNDKYYCSELIYEMLLRANNGKEVFPLNVMTFKSLGTGKTTQSWIEYFEEHDLPIPEGELGINPGAMSRSDVIDIIHCY